MALAAAVDSTVGESSPNLCTLPKENTYEPLGINIEELPRDGPSGSGSNPPPFTNMDFHVDVPIEVNNKVEEHSFISMSPVHRSQGENPELKSLSTLRNVAEEEDICVSLRLGDREPKRQRSEPAGNSDSPK